MRFVNRRRFVRVPTQHRAFIALYPFLHLENTDPEKWTPVHFVPATVTELAGPGLRLETGLKTAVGDRVLVSFRIEVPHDTKQADAASGCIIETMGEVKRIEPIFDQFALSLHLIGLKDSDVDRLVRMTNEVARISDPAKTPEPPPPSPEQIEADAVLEAVIDGEGDSHA